MIWLKCFGSKLDLLKVCANKELSPLENIFHSLLSIPATASLCPLARLALLGSVDGHFDELVLLSVQPI